MVRWEYFLSRRERERERGRVGKNVVWMIEQRGRRKEERGRRNYKRKEDYALR